MIKESIKCWDKLLFAFEINIFEEYIFLQVLGDVLLCIYKKGLVIYKINIFNSKHYPTPVKNIFFIKCFLYVRHVVFPLMVSSTPIYSHIRIFRETYEWRRSMHILAGLNLQTVPLAAVLRKSPFPKKWDIWKNILSNVEPKVDVNPRKDIDCSGYMNVFFTILKPNYTQLYNAANWYLR